MQSINWKGLVEIFGISALVASLVFVGLQLQQSQDIAIAETFLSILDSELEVLHATNENAEIWAKANGGSQLTDAETVVFENLVRRSFIFSTLFVFVNICVVLIVFTN